MSGLREKGIALYGWFEERLGLGAPIIEAAEHEVPENTASWWYVFGSAATVLLVLQVMTGVLLALVYEPSASHAWSSLQFLDHNVKLGWYLRAMHGWGSDFMIAIVLIHMAQVFLFGAYKFPRELTWIIGVFLLLLTLGMAFTGQVLRFDQDAYWGLGIGASILSRVPMVGGPLVDIMLGGPIIAGPTLTRFFALHVFVIPGTLLALVGLHVWMVLKLGINDWPMPGRVVRKSTYMQEYHELTKKTGIPFIPDAAWKDAIFAVAIMLSVMACALRLGRSVLRDSPIRQLLRRLLSPTLRFFGFTRFLRIFRRAWRLRLCLSLRFLALGRCCCCRWLRVRERSTGAAPGCRVDAGCDCGGAGSVHASRHVYAVESGDGCVVERSDSGEVPAGAHSVGATGRAGFAGEAVPQLPFNRGSWRASRAEAGCGCGAHDRGPDDSPGAAGGRQHAGVWERA